MFRERENAEKADVLSSLPDRQEEGVRPYQRVTEQLIHIVVAVVLWGILMLVRFDESASLLIVNPCKRGVTTLATGILVKQPSDEHYPVSILTLHHSQLFLKVRRFSISAVSISNFQFDVPKDVIAWIVVRRPNWKSFIRKIDMHSYFAVLNLRIGVPDIRNSVGNASLFPVHTIHKDNSSNDEFSGVCSEKLLLADFLKLASRSKETPCKCGYETSKDGGNRRSVVVKGFSEMPEPNKRRVINGAIFVAGILILAADLIISSKSKD